MVNLPRLTPHGRTTQFASNGKSLQTRNMLLCGFHICLVLIPALPYCPLFKSMRSREMLWGRWNFLHQEVGGTSTGCTCGVREGSGSGTGAKWSRNKVFHLLRQVSEKLSLHMSWGAVVWRWAGAQPVTSQLCPSPEQTPLGKCREGIGKEQAVLALGSVWLWICPWELCPGGQQTGPQWAVGDPGEALGRGRLQQGPWEGGKLQRGTIFSARCQAGFAQGNIFPHGDSSGRRCERGWSKPCSGARFLIRKRI